MLAYTRDGCDALGTSGPTTLDAFSLVHGVPIVTALPMSGREEGLGAPLRFEMDLPDNEPGRVGGRQIRLDPPANDRLADLRCPVLAIAGTLDFSDSVATAWHLAADAPNARALVWDDVAHMIGMEQPMRLADTIVDWVRRNGTE